MVTEVKLTSLLLLFIFISSCTQNEKTVIALSKGVGSENYLLYKKWLNSYNEKLEIINLYGLSYDEALEKLKECSGIILTGGPDVHPAFYGRGFDTSRCSIDSYRDTLEFRLINEINELKLPLLAICRGAQIMNVAYGGSLIVDIPDDFGNNISHQSSEGDVFHNISIEDGSMLNILSESAFGTVNSNHHQAVDSLADMFSISALSSDGIIEAFEYKDKSKPFMLAVQWHPERMEADSRLSQPLALKFIEEAEKYRLKVLANR